MASSAPGRSSGPPRTPQKLVRKSAGQTGSPIQKKHPTPKASQTLGEKSQTPARPSKLSSQDPSESFENLGESTTREAKQQVKSTPARNTKPDYPAQDDDDDSGPEGDLQIQDPQPVDDDSASEPNDSEARAPKMPKVERHESESQTDAPVDVETPSEAEAASDEEDASHIEKPSDVDEEGDVEDQVGDAKAQASKGKQALSQAAKQTQRPNKQRKDSGNEPDDATAGAADEEGGDPADDADDVTEGAESQQDDLQNTGEETAEATEEGVSDLVEDADDKAEDDHEEAAEATEEGVSELADDAGDAAEGDYDEQDGEVEHDDQEEQDEEAEGVDEQGNKLGETTDEAADVTDDIAKDVEQDGPKAIDFSILKGLEVDSEGLVHNKEGKAIGHLVEGDAEDLEGYPIGDDGEILDDDGDLVGRCELLPEKAEELRQEAEEGADDAQEGELGVDILEGLSCDSTGLIFNDDGDTLGQLVEGDASECKGRPLNDKGEVLDDEGNVIGRAEVHPEAYELYEYAPDEDEEDGEEQGEAQQDDEESPIEAQKTVEETGEAIEEEAEPELPGIEALAGQKLNDEGQVVDDEGNVLGELAEGSISQVKGMSIDEQGQVVDEEGNVIGKVELAEGAAEQLAEAAGGKPDLRILEGLKVNKKGKILDEEGEPIGELIDGDTKDCAGKKVNEKGEVVDKNGDVIGRVKIVPGEAADEATRLLLERLGELEEDAKLPDLEILDGLKVNKKGKILNEDGEPIGELVDGDPVKCAGKKCNEKGEVLDNKGKVIGRVKTLPQVDDDEETEGEDAAAKAEDAAAEAEGAAGDAQDAAAEGEEAAEEAGEEAESDLPPLSILEGLSVNKSGKIVDKDGKVVGELVEGDAKKLSKSGVTADAEGQFWDNKGHVIGRAQTVASEDPEEEAPFAGLEGLVVNKDGYIEDENGNVVGVVTEGNWKKLVGRSVDEDGDILDKKGSVVGHAERYEDPEEVPEEAADLSFLAGKTVNKQGNVIGDEGVPIARLVEGNPKEVSGKKLDNSGQIWNDRGQVIGRVELIPESEREAKPEGPFAGLEDLRVIQGGNVADEDGNVVGTIVEGNPKRLIGLSVDEDGDIIDKYGNVKGHAEPLPEEADPEAPDLSILENKVLNKQGFVVGEDGIPVGKLVEGNVKELAGRRCDEQGQIHGDTGKVVGRCELIPENERVARPEGPFAGFEGLHVVKDGYVEDEDGNVVGVLVDGNPKRLIGHAVDEDGDIIDKYGNTKGHAEPYEEAEEEAIDLSALAGCTVNKAGNVVDGNGKIMGRVVEGEISNMIGRKVDGQGQIWDNSGNVIGRAELAGGVETNPDGPFAGFDNLTVVKDGSVVTDNGDIVGRIIEGDIKKLVGHHPDEDGDINDKNGNTIGKAERWEPEEKERRINPMSGLRVNKEGEVRDVNGELIGRLTAGDLGHCAGLEIDDNGYVIDNDGNKVGEVTLLENIAEEEPEDETEEEKQRREDAKTAQKMIDICQQTLERVQPVCKRITELIEQADRTPKKDLDEEKLVNDVKPLIEEGARILEECNGALRALDPDGSIAARAKGRAASKEATPEEYRLADLLKELTSTVVTTIDNAKKKLNNMPGAKKKLNPLWGLLTEPLFQILAAVGLLLAGVLNLVGRLLGSLGLGGLVNGLLGGLGIKKLLGGLGLGGLGESLGGGKKKEGGGAGSLPVIGGLLGKDK